MKRIVKGLLAIVLIVQTLSVAGCSSGGAKSLQILDSGGNEMAFLQTVSDARTELTDSAYRAYLEAVLSECEILIAEQNNCDVKKARKFLLENECTVYTAMDSRVFSSVQKAYEQQNQKDLSFGCAVTDLHGSLLALFSAGADGQEYVNYATEKTPPYSSFKPLCVYTPAMENGLADWSTVYLDAPIKKVETENGKKVDWPSNATGTYTNANATVAEAVKTSLNTVAVRCMQTVGVKNSLSFLESKFGLTLDFEKKKAEAYGEDEVIGNVALGHLYEGVSPAAMAGYYQIFANGGYYTKPHTVLKICKKSGDTVYEYHSDESQVIKSTTAYLMNRLLQTVVTAGGTGEKARCEGVTVGGKTGTGDFGNWFVGFTPQYTCAVWHGTELAKNTASELFSKAVSGFDHTAKKNFPNCAGIKKAAYCCESGMLFSAKCKKADMGYYVSDQLPKTCNIHQSF